MSGGRPWSLHRARVPEALEHGALLDAAERTRAARFRFQEDRDRFVAAHGLARSVLGRALGSDPRRLAFGEGAHGKPFLLGGATLRFNLSHSGDWVAVALCEAHDVGVDVELARPHLDVLSLARSVFTEAERDALGALDAAGRLSAFYRLWARKEAAMKAWGVGLSLDPRSVHVGVDEAPVRVVDAPGAAFEPAIVEDVAIDDRHAGAVAVARGR